MPATAFAQLDGPVETASASFVSLGGPSVTVEVPASGRIAVAASAIGLDLDGDDNTGVLSLFEDGVQMPGQSGLCTEQDGVLFTTFPELVAEPQTAGTPGVPAGIAGCATAGAPGPVYFVTTPGQHTYELRYAQCGCTPGVPAGFRQVRLWVTPMP